MKKLLSITAISLLLSGCFSSVNLSNSNTSANANGINKLSNQDVNSIAFLYAQTFVCSNGSAKKSPEWNNFRQEMEQYFSQLNNQDASLISIAFVTRVSVDYFRENNIPITPHKMGQFYPIFLPNDKIKLDVVRSTMKVMTSDGCTKKVLDIIKENFYKIIISKA